ncbi:Ytp1 family protein [Aspergillus novofumigatus IBT 16806]|uniref:Integral membrane protein n=1 Tax=Aspergillus novofumigatus (strain IBT 16806) TaxID=1392255 RepID=A0A2I1BSL2_ASPN1|nr:uncharacterized protein P174DRAFT_426085 [Aspergillus novofumigatus IBT 16806]PKX88397.1 hypothetical protein P174DRAFT_426085 [Aspergillus novofumigatus IBT 16806]
MGILDLQGVLTALLLASSVVAHGGHEGAPEAAAVSEDLIDAILWIHMILMGFTFGIIFPLGMVLGIVRSRWHVPLQIVGTVIAVVACFLGHAHKGRQFGENVHASFANLLMVLLVVQVIIGLCLKLQLFKRIHGRIHRIFMVLHSVLGKAMPVGDHLGQCLAHFIMGSAFIAYGIMLTILLLVGQFWLPRTGRSQEFFDSLVIAAWGCVNTFTEHRWGEPWGHNDLQHTSMGIVWWCAGLLGIWMSRKRNGRPKRNLIPAVVILLTGCAMSAHPQTLMISTLIHSIFGYTLMAAGFTRIVEIAFVLKDKNTVSLDGADPSSFQYLPPFLLYVSGFLFMGATEEQMQLLHDAGITHVSYVLILYSIAFILFLFVNILLHIYTVHAWPDSAKLSTDSRSLSTADQAHVSFVNDHSRSMSETQQINDIEAFELQGLISDEDEDGPGNRDHAMGPRKAEDEESAPLVARPCYRADIPGLA